MATLVLVFGLMLLFTDVFSVPGQGLLIENPNRIILVVIFIFYSVYRYLRGWQVFKKNTRELEKKKWERN
ncbi:MAG: hypothetical protein ACK5D5_03340 [Bacteroidota bacterium]